MLSKSFKPGKCKTSLKLAVSRIKLLKNKRDIHVKHLRRELAELLASGQEQTARIRVEHVIREEKTMSAYDLIEIYCELIVARLPIIESQKSCPIDLKEAVSSVIFASPRCADLPELVDVRKHFAAKYGKDFSTAALELRPDSGVNRMIVEKLSAKAPDIETKIKILTAIAKEHDVKWDSKAYEEELQKPKEDLLNGSSSFMRANMITMEPLNANFSPVASQNEAASNILRNEEPRNQTSFNSASHTNFRTSASPVPPTRNESTTSDRKAGVSEARDSHPSKGNASFNQPTWTMEFKDAVSAAQVAAESAERASMAARAAAALAGQGNISRQNSNNDSNASSIHGSRQTMPNRVSSLKQIDESSESVSMDYNQVKGFQGAKEEIDNFPREELLRGDILHHDSDDKEFSSQTNKAEKFEGFRESFSRMEHVRSKKQDDEVEFVEENERVNYDRTTSASSFNTFDDDGTIWTPIGKHQTGDSSHPIGDHNQHASSDFAAPVFDDYDPEPNEKRNLFDSNIFSNTPRTSGVNSSIFNDSFRESRDIKAEKVPSSKFDDSRSVTFDDSDGISSEDEDDLSRPSKSVTVQNSGLLHEGIGPREEKDQLQVPSSSSSSGAKASEHDGGDELGLKFGRLTGGFKNRGYNYPPYTASSGVDSFPSSKETTGSTFSSTERTISRQEKAVMSHLEADEGRYDQESNLKASTNPESAIKAKGFGVEEYTDVNRSNKALTRDKSIEGASGFSVNQLSSNRESRRRTISQQEKAFTSHVEADEGRYDQESSLKASTNPESAIKAKGFGVEGYTEVNRSNKALARDKSIEDASGFSVNQLSSDRESRRRTISRQEKAVTSHVEENEGSYVQESSLKASTNPESAIKAKGFGVEEYTDVNRSNKALARDKSIEDASGFTVNQVSADRESRRRYRGDDPYNSTVTNAPEATGSEVIDHKIYDEKPHAKAYKELSSRMPRADFDSDGVAGSKANPSTNSNIKLSRRTRDYLTKGRNADSERQPLSQGVNEAKVSQGGNLNLKSRRSNSSADEPMPVNNKNAEERPNPDATPLSSGNIKTSDSGSGTKLQGSETPKAAHVHPRLPDYETLAAHFQSLRSNRR